jgi:hypothetical protein
VITGKMDGVIDSFFQITHLIRREIVRTRQGYLLGRNDERLLVVAPLENALVCQGDQHYSLIQHGL